MEPCNASTKGALNMAKLGFRVKELMGGMDWWKRDGYKTEGSLGIKNAKLKRARERKINYVGLAQSKVDLPLTLTHTRTT